MTQQRADKRTMHAFRSSRIAALVLAFVVVLYASAAGAALAPSVARDFHEKAIQLEAEGKDLEAIIELKNALQADPKHLPSLLLSARIYLDQTLGLAAEDALHTALDAGADRNLALPLLGEALLQQRKAARVLVELDPKGLGREAAAHVHALRAEAHLLRHELFEAGNEIDAARKLEPDLLEAKLADTTRLMLLHKPRDARDMIETAVREAPDSSEAWSLRGGVEHALRNVDAALEAYAHSIELDPRNLDARIARIGLFIDLGRDGDTTADLDYIDREFPDEPRAAYLRSVIAARRGDLEAANQALDKAASELAPLDAEAFENDPALLLIQGLANYGLQRYEAAVAPLRAYIAKVPQDLGARKALGDILLRLGSAREAIPVLEPAATLAAEDPRAQLLLATAYAISGYETKATDLLERTAGAPHSAAAARGRLALLNIGAGRVNEGLSDLAAAFAEDPSDAQGGVGLVVTYLRSDRAADAVTAARRLLTTEPANAVFRNLLGIALFSNAQLDEARSEFEQVLGEHPDFRPAAINLAKLALRQGHPDEARERLERLLAVAPDDSKLLLELSRVALASGDRREGLRLAEDAARPRKASIEALFHLYDLYLADGNLQGAYELALRAKGRADNNFAALERLAMVYMRMDKTEDARATLKTMSQVSGFDPDKQLRTASYQVRIGQFGDAEYSLYKALQENPDDARIALARVEVSLAKPSFEEALERADGIIAKHPELAAAHLLRAQALLNLGRNTEALAGYDRVLELKPTSEAVLGGYRALSATGQAAAARARLEQWLQAHPDDQSVRGALAEDLIRGGELARARDLYRALAQQKPSDVDILNNLAMLNLDLGDTAAAEDAARQAQALAPESPMVNDTLGWILAQGGEHDEALGYLRDALARRAGDNEIRYHLAFVLDKLQRPAEARRELDKALASGRPFPSRDAALALRDGLAR